MHEFFGSVVQSVAQVAPRPEDLSQLAQNSRQLLDLAGGILSRLQAKGQQNLSVLSGDLAQAAQMPADEFARQARALTEQGLPQHPPEYRQRVADYLTLFPSRIRATFARPGDPSGATSLATWLAREAEDLVPLLPPRPPRFREGDTPPGAPNYRLVERLGIGGFGEVWKAQNLKMASTFRAFKFCLDPVAQVSIIQNEMANIELVQNELSDHQNIVKLIEAHFDSDTPWLQYEYIPGGDLGQNVATWSNDPAARATTAVEKVLVLAETLAMCHALTPRAVIHRDMKPANVLIGRNGTLKITDFGISNTQAQQTLDAVHIATMTNSLIRWANTPLYSSRQQQLGHTPHPSDDVHALGVMLYQLVLGTIERPLDRDYIRVLETRSVARELISLISQCIASDLEDRYQHAGELAEALKRLPRTLIAPADPAKALYAVFDEKAAEARVKNDQARALLDQRKWPEAVTTLESIFHPVLREADLYSRAVAHRDGKRFINALGMEFAIVPKGTFWMGGGDGKCGDKQVTIDHDFFIGVYPVTQEEWQKVMGTTPSHFRKGGGGDSQIRGVPDADLKRFPVESVSWNTCQEFIRKLNEKSQENNWIYRLPREGEWEYICRGSASSKSDCAFSYYFKTPTNTLSPQQANTSEASLGRTCKVGLYQPNALGIFDLHGNVWEWCEDLYDSGPNRVIRGGSWNYSAEYCRAGYRNNDSPDLSSNNLGLRVARVPVR